MLVATLHTFKYRQLCLEYPRIFLLEKGGDLEVISEYINLFCSILCHIFIYVGTGSPFLSIPDKDVSLSI